MVKGWVVGIREEKGAWRGADRDWSSHCRELDDGAPVRKIVFRWSGSFIGGFGPIYMREKGGVFWSLLGIFFVVRMVWKGKKKSGDRENG